MFDKSTINFYNLYVTDSWHIKPTLTLTYGLGYQVEMPPVEQNGKQVELVDSKSAIPSISPIISTPKSTMALQGQVYNPIIGFSTIANVTGASHKYPFNPFYGGVSPRVAVAWNPKYNDGILGKVVRRRQDRDPRRIRPDLQPSERRRPGADSAARRRSRPAGFLHWRFDERPVPG